MAVHASSMRHHCLPVQACLLSSALLSSKYIRYAARYQTHSLTVKGRNGANLACHSPTVGAARSSNYEGIHHVGILCESISESTRFYQDILGMQLNPDRPHDKLPYRGAWLWVGEEMIHLMELPNPDPLEGRPEHGGRDRHMCLSVKNIAETEQTLQRHNIPYTKSKSGRAALFFRDPDMNTLEFVQQ